MALSKNTLSALRLTAALVPTAPLALYTSFALAAHASLSSQSRAALALYLPLPLYVLFACLAVRARWFVAWPVCIAATAVAWWLSFR